jgi:hypothetical protein
MGERGHTLHVLDGNARDALARVGRRLAVLGCNERWTTFVPIDASAFDDEGASKIVDRTLLHVWFDDDAGLAVQVYVSGTFVGELSLPGDDPSVTDADVDLARRLEELELLSRSQRAALLKRISDASGLRAWTMNHGFERFLGLPCTTPMPTDASEQELRRLLPESAIVVEPTKTGGRGAKTRTRKPKAAVASKPPAPPKESWSERERATLELHCEYWRTVFSMNNWKLYNRYKKHLPPDERRDVDELCNAVASGNDEELAARVKGILARIWSAEDWDKVIRDPQLIDGDDDVWHAWLARVSA